MNIVIGVLFSVIGALALRTISKIDKNQARLYAWIEKLSKDFYQLQGYHNARINMGARCGTDKDQPDP
jgi:hypothetical protein